MSEARRQRLLSEEHFSVDGTLLEAWASLKSVRPRFEKRDPFAGAGGRNPWKDFPFPFVVANPLRNTCHGPTSHVYLLGWKRAKLRPCSNSTLFSDTTSTVAPIAWSFLTVIVVLHRIHSDA